MMRAFSCAVAGSDVGWGGGTVLVVVVVEVVVIVPDDEGRGDEEASAFGFCALLLLVVVVVDRADLGDDVGGSSGFASGMGCGFVRMAS